MTIKELVTQAQEQKSYDLPYSTQLLLIFMAEKLIELAETYIPRDCETCSHENCIDCDRRLDGWQLGI